MIRSELSHRYKQQTYQAGEGIFSNIGNKLAAVVSSNAGKKLITKTVDSAIDHGAKKAGEFIVDQLTKRPSELIREHLATIKKPPYHDDDTYIRHAFERMLQQ